jgi:hypothetical protein
MTLGFNKYGGSGWTAFAGWLAATVGFFLILAVFDCAIPEIRNIKRIGAARELSAALEAYRREHGEFPKIPGGNHVLALDLPLVQGGYLPNLPDESHDYMYKSAGDTFALLVPLHHAEFLGYPTNDDACMVGSDQATAEYWGKPKCRL